MTGRAHPTSGLVTVAELGVELRMLDAQRFDAVDAGLADNRLYMDRLVAEIEACRAEYVGASVTEIASLRAQLSGPMRG